MSEKIFGVAIIGCGNIAQCYAQDLFTYPNIGLVGMTDVHLERAQALAAQFNSKVYSSVDELLADDEVELVVNLTIPHAHKAIITRCLEAGKHVHSEKPLALNHQDAQELVELAHQKGLRLSCSPFIHMGEGQQTAWKWIRDERLGLVRLAYAEANWGRIETWHPDPVTFYQVGPLFDIGVYPLTLITTFFGPVRQVKAFGSVLFPNRVTISNTPFQVETPDYVTAMVELANGTLLRLTVNYYVSRSSKQHRSMLEIHGDEGSLSLSDWHNFDGKVEFAEFGQPYQPVPWLKEPFQGSKGIEWGRVILDVVDAIAQGKPHRATGEHAAHIVEVLNAIERSMEGNEPVRVRSEFVPPMPMDWAMID